MTAIYKGVLMAAGALSIASWALAISLLLLRRLPPFDGAHAVMVVMGLVILFALASLFLRWRNGGPLCIPTTAALHKTAIYVAIGFAVAWFAIGFARYPAAPYRVVNGAWHDKGGRERTQGEYEAFRRWEASLPVAWLPFALSAVTSLAVMTTSKTLRYC
jgi:hypothetical protein